MCVCMYIYMYVCMYIWNSPLSAPSLSLHATKFELNCLPQSNSISANTVDLKQESAGVKNIWDELKSITFLTHYFVTSMELKLFMFQFGSIYCSNNSKTYGNSLATTLKDVETIIATGSVLGITLSVVWLRYYRYCHYFPHWWMDTNLNKET